MAQRKSKGTLDGKIAGLYDLDKTIGKGHFAVVKLARHVFTGERVAVKVIDKTKLDEISKSHLFQEVRCMKLVQHPNVVRLYEVIDTQTKLYLILELGDGGDLYDYIMKHEQGLGEDSARKYFRQIVEAISYCHKLHVVHRDLKPENVVFFEKQGIVKLTDFGFSNMFKPSEKLETACGSLAYSAPEILLGDSYDPPAVDVWSLGVILFMLCCGEPPFQEANDSETLTMILDCKYKMPVHVSQECKDLVSIMLKREPSERASLEEILCHDWLHMQMEDMPPPALPLISREHLTEEDHNYLVEKMVEGEIGTKEEILKSIEKDEYSHITATYYLLAERKLKQHRQELQNSLSQIRKHSAPSGGKPHLEPLALSPRDKARSVSCQENHSACGKMKYDCIQTKDNDQKEEPSMPKISIVQSLVSPPGTHPSPGQSISFTPDRDRLLPRKYSLIQEESEDYDDDDMEVEEVDIHHARSAENLLDDSSYRPEVLSPVGYENMNLKRPLISVASSPQLLKQICEENESDEEDDFVPSKIHSPRMKNRSRCASPEMIRKYEQRRRKGAGSRGHSCSSSDASDTDDTEGRSRKDKLKHKFMHRRRDSSDHSSDTDGGPSGPGGGNLGGGSGFDGGHGRPPKERKDRDHKDDGGGSGKGSGSKDNKSGKTRQQNHLVNNDLNGRIINGRTSELSISSAISNLSVGSKNSLKYIVEKNESDIEDNCSSNDYCSNSGSSRQSSQNPVICDFHSLTNSPHKDFFRLADKENLSQSNTLISSSVCSPKVKSRKLNNMKVDINRNGYCHVHHSQQVPTVKADTKCCSVV
ncbi:MAP/microtubule affinity-regulating kinase 3-like isoform X2 [Mytilus galloprovincialis]|uniref:MAP/microtubule affinity-regulating kinase 3-like isoform X2 n=1 Tax=Mytilus galloprovincialis TaxID=29158 RepID=UPI003F7CBEED